MRFGPALSAVALILLAWSVPSVMPGTVGFPAHMLFHMTLVALAAPLVALAFRDLPAPPVLAGAAAEFVVVWAWHLPALQGMACASPELRYLEYAMFLGAGWAVWAGALKPGAPLAGAGGLFLTSMHMTLLGALLVIAPADLFAAACDRPPDLAGQQLGGMLMLAIGTPAYLLGGLWLVRRALQSDAPATKGQPT